MVIFHEQGRDFNLWIQYHDFLGVIPRQLPWYNTTKFRGIILCFFLHVQDFFLFLLNSSSNPYFHLFFQCIFSVYPEISFVLAQCIFILKMYRSAFSMRFEHFFGNLATRYSLTYFLWCLRTSSISRIWFKHDIIDWRSCSLSTQPCQLYWDNFYRYAIVNCWYRFRGCALTDPKWL